MFKINGPMDDLSLANILGDENEYELLNQKAKVSPHPSSGHPMGLDPVSHLESSNS